jgi:hypothetical protein
MEQFVFNSGDIRTLENKTGRKMNSDWSYIPSFQALRSMTPWSDWEYPLLLNTVSLGARISPPWDIVQRKKDYSCRTVYINHPRPFRPLRVPNYESWPKQAWNSWHVPNLHGMNFHPGALLTWNYITNRNVTGCASVRLTEPRNEPRA